MYFDIPSKSEHVKDWNDLLIKREGESYSDFEKSKPLFKNQYLHKQRESDMEME
ncbi:MULTISPECIES: hypothetical protein [Nosocomiicoccus]|uniref:hypothetical protein n=1 Tax=Nosocomiicoccus TaxID=489909 RepID=UPI001438C468|nr:MULTISPECIES: hypothetical protein [Nosocomiicoccus]